MASILHKGNQQSRTIERKLVLSFWRFCRQSFEENCLGFLKAKGYQCTHVLYTVSYNAFGLAPWAMLEYGGITYNTVLKE